MASRHLVSASVRETLFGVLSDTASLERNYVLADDDLDLICTRRSAENRLGLAIHIALLRHLGPGWLRHPERDAFVPQAVGHPAPWAAALRARRQGNGD